MKIIKIEPVPMATAKEVMVRREKQGELNYEQKLSLEHLKNFTKLNEKDAKKFIEEITAIIKMSPETLVQIVNILPNNPDELRMIFAREKFSLKEDEIKQILDVVAKFK